MFIVITTDNPESQLIDLMHKYLAGKQEVPLSQRKVDEAAREGRALGYREGISEGIAAMLTERRIAALPYLSHVALVDPWDVAQALKPYLESYWRPTHKMDSDEDRKKFDARMTEALESLLALRTPEEYAAENELIRRNKVLSGEVEPLDEDAGWLRSSAEEAEALANQIRILQEKAMLG